MKKLTFLVVLLMGSMFVSCSLINTVSDEGKRPQRVEQDLPEAVKYAMDAPKGTLRAFGEYTYDEEGYAYRFATAQARANLAEVISVKVKTGIEMFRSGYKKGAITSEEVKRDVDAEGRDLQLIRQVCEEYISGANVVKSNCYLLPNGTYQVYVCVEANTESVADYISKNERVQQLISDSDRMKIDFGAENFSKVINIELNK